MPRKSKIHLVSLLISIFALTACEKKPSPQNYFPSSGREALHQTALDLQGGVAVLALALRPGYEDLSTLAYLRMGRGANITSAYLTNGEAAESDLRTEYPHYLAARRRAEAVNALTYLGGETYFLNLPDVIAARDSLKLRQAWSSDSVRARLVRLIVKTKPSIILIAADRAQAQPSLQSKFLRHAVLDAVQHLSPEHAKTNGAASQPEQYWRVRRVFVESSRPENAVRVPVEEKHPKWQKRYRLIGAEAASQYQSFRLQRKTWQEAQSYAYQIVFPNAAEKLNALDEGMGEAASRGRLHEVAWRMSRFTADLLEGNTNAATKRLAALADSVNYYMEQRYLLNASEVQSIYHWKGTLDKLQCLLLGATVDYEFSDTALTALQVSFLTIKNVTGISEKGETLIFFGATAPGWIINEGFDKRFTYKPGERFSLLSPQQVDFNTPAALHGLDEAKATRLFTFHVIHRAAEPEHSFIYRIDKRMSFAPRFLVEVTTPLVRMFPGEWIELNLKNFSRDGVADTIRVAGDLAASNAFAFRLSQKEAEQKATLYLDWKGNGEEGTYRIPVTIAGDTVAWFAARKFAAQVNRDKKVGVLSGLATSSLTEALRRLGMKARLLETGKITVQQLDSLDVLILDRRALSLAPEISKRQENLTAFVRRGGHLLVFAQDAAAWQAASLWKDLQLAPTAIFDEETRLQTIDNHPLLSAPNVLTAEDWNGWLNARGYNLVRLVEAGAAEAPVRAMENGAPLLVTKKLEQGKLTYVDLALTPQLLNLHPGAFRLLANLISY
ncbi:PIG-L family deacetylase [candidate division KSB1 bacterium]|nr:PIG-L family deacetylase [candidate division KSB1 bacterium]